MQIVSIQGFTSESQLGFQFAVIRAFRRWIVFALTMQLSGEKVIKCKANAWLSRCKSACQVGWKKTQGKRRGRRYYERRPDKLSSKSSSMPWIQRQRRVEIFVQQVIANLKPESKHQCDCLRKEDALKEVWPRTTSQDHSFTEASPQFHLLSCTLCMCFSGS